MAASREFDWDGDNRRVIEEGTNALRRTAESLDRSQQVALETEQIGSSIAAELGEQREVLIRAKDRLSDMNEGLDESRSILRRMGREIIYNKLILILIILSELSILGIRIYLKFIR